MCSSDLMPVPGRHDQAPAAEQLVGVRPAALAYLHGLLAQGNAAQIRLQPQASALRQLPEGSQYAALRGIVHGADAVLPRHPGLRQHGQIPPEARRFLHQPGGIARQQLLPEAPRQQGGALEADPFAQDDVLSRGSGS